MGSIDRDLRKIFDTERDMTRTPAGLVDVVARKAGRRRGATITGTATAGLAVVGLAATLGVTLVQDTEPADNSGTPAIVVFTPGFLNLPYYSHASWYCDEAPPPSAPITAEFTLTTDTSPIVVDYADAKADDLHLSITRNHEDSTLSSRTSGGGVIITSWLFIQDGAVVAYQESASTGIAYSGADGLASWEEGESFGYNLDNLLVTRCDGKTDRFWDLGTPLPSGDYLAIPLIRIVSTPQIDAALVLADLGSNWYGPVDLSLEPGSWGCRDYESSAGFTPIECLEQAVVDPETGQVSIEIPPDQRNPERDVLLIGQPIPLTVTGTPPPPPPIEEASGWFEEEPFSTCEDETSEFQADAGVEVINSSREFVLGNISSELISILGDKSLDGTVRFPGAIEATIYRYQFSTGNWLAVGHAETTIDEGKSFVLDRYTGPTEVDLTLSPITWCGDGHPDPSGYYTIELEGEIELVDEDGDVERYSARVIWD